MFQQSKPEYYEMLHTMNLLIFYANNKLCELNLHKQFNSTFYLQNENH